jgi:hypothetical protein
MKIGSAEHIAWECLIADGNHNNTPLIDRALHRFNEGLMRISAEIHVTLCSVAALTETEDNRQRMGREILEGCTQAGML